MGRKMGELKKAGDGLDKLFSAGDTSEVVELLIKGNEQSTEEASESVSERPKKGAKGNAKKSEKNVPEAKQKPQKKVFSFRAEVESADSWRVWADAKGLKVDELGSKAIAEYIKRHPLTADQQKIYDLKMAQKKS